MATEQLEWEDLMSGEGSSVWKKMGGRGYFKSMARVNRSYGEGNSLIGEDKSRFSYYEGIFSYTST